MGPAESKEAPSGPCRRKVERSLLVAGLMLLVAVDAAGVGYLVRTRLLAWRSRAVGPDRPLLVAAAHLKCAPPPPTLSAKVVIDPGHGGRDPGATGPTGLHEKDVVLDVALKLAAYLHGKGVRTVLTRQSDVFVSLADRVAVANRERPDLFVSIHANSNKVHGLRGSMTLYPNDGPREAAPNPSEKAAGVIESALAPITGRCGAGQDGLVEDVRQLRVLRRTHAPAVLVEADFLSNPTSERLLASAAYRRAIAEAIGSAIMEYLGGRARHHAGREAASGLSAPGIRTSHRLLHTFSGQGYRLGEPEP